MHHHQHKPEIPVLDGSDGRSQRSRQVAFESRLSCMYVLVSVCSASNILKKIKSNQLCNLKWQRLHWPSWKLTVKAVLTTGLLVWVFLIFLLVFLLFLILTLSLYLLPLLLMPYNHPRPINIISTPPPPPPLDCQSVSSPECCSSRPISVYQPG